MTDKLNNLLSFKEFTQFPSNTKKTKRTDIGGDVINENFYDKLIYQVINNRDIEKSITDLKTRQVKAAKSGQVRDLKIDGDKYNYTILNREFKLDGNEMSVKTPVSTINKKIDDWTKFTISDEYADEIRESLDDIDYL